MIIQFSNQIEKIITKINDSELNDFISFAKEYNIFQESNSKVYDRICDLIKARLDREGLSHETVRPE